MNTFKRPTGILKTITGGGNKIEPMEQNNVESLTDEQIAEFKRAFQAFDKDDGGTIDADELGCAMRQLGQNPSMAELQDMIEEVDKDNSGTIDFPEFLDMMSRKMNDNDDEDDVLAAMMMFDKDGSKTISADELRFVLTNLGEKMTPEDVESVLKSVTISPDGKVDMETFVKLIVH